MLFVAQVNKQYPRLNVVFAGFWYDDLTEEIFRLLKCRLFAAELMQQYTYPTKEELKQILSRPAADYAKLQQPVQEIFDVVQKEGDAAVKRFTEQFDKVSLNQLQLTQAEIQAALISVDENLKAAIEVAADNIRKFHEAQLREEAAVETTEGVTCWRVNRGIESVGLYIPGGTAPLFSTVLMLGIPAQIAGCKEVVLCSPPTHNHSIHPAIIYAASKCGISKIFKVGGVQAIAAMSFGTESIPKVFKLFGPGNAYVTVAKQVSQKYGLAIDMPAGPSEVMVVADDTANPMFVAADLLSQAEHGHDSQVVLVALSKPVLEASLQAVAQQLPLLPRKDIATRVLQNSKAILVEDIGTALEIANQYAAEHLILSVADAEALLPKISNAGSIFLGNYTPESCGDYASGTNHTLPTNGFATSYSGVSVDSFIKKISVQSISKQGLRNIGNTVIAMAEAEQLQAHANAVSIRLENL